MAAFAEPTLTPELLEKFRSIGLRLDRNGHLWHQDEEVKHPRLRQAILRWLAVNADGRDIVRLDEQRYAYIDVEDAHLRVTSARWRDDDRLELSLDDGTTEELAYATLAVAADDGLACQVRGGQLRARFSSAAQQVALERVETQGPGFALRAAGASWNIASGA